MAPAAPVTQFDQAGRPPAERTAADLCLALDCSTPYLAIAVVDGAGRVLGRFAEDVGRDHAARAVGEVARLVDAVPGGRARIGRVVAGTGPGSYTGLRVALATASGLARALGAEFRGAPSFAALAAGVLAPGEEAVVTVDARRGNVYAARCTRAAADPSRAPVVVVVTGPKKVVAAQVPQLGAGVRVREAGTPDAAALAVSEQAGPPVAVYL